MYNNSAMTRTTLLFLAAAACGFAAAPESFPTSAGTLEITPIQHASLVIQAGGKVLYVDPAMGSYNGLPQADYILITDIHQDHLEPDIVNKLKKPGTIIVAPKAVAAQLSGVKVLANGEKTTVGPFAVEAIPMYNMKRGPSPGQLYHDKGRGDGYIVTYGGKRFYFSGDTEAIPEMKALKNIDVAFVCMNLPYTMTPQEAAEAVRAFHPAIVYPYHYMGSDTKEFAKALEGTGIDVRLRNWYQ
ncbi:MAG TPA: MBL fold metallo-hydrolase [Bryobacteraceae bacterium]|jgi:L-ascorbate metabolism protein UlaG (beta-lactamase superfamily)